MWESVSYKVKSQSWSQLAEHAFVAATIGYIVKKYVVDGGVKQNLGKAAIGVLKQLPGAATMIEREKQQMLDEIEHHVLDPNLDLGQRYATLPEEGVSADELLKVMKENRGQEKTYSSGKAFGGIYTDVHAIHEIIAQAYALYADSNALYPNLFPALRKYEAEVVSMVAHMLGGDKDVCGTMTSGGTESILMAVKAYREWGKKTKNIQHPEIIISTTNHPAIVKGCYYFGVKCVVVPVGADFRADVAGYKKSITSNTVAIAASAPTFPHGAIDDIEALGVLAQSHGIGFHVDSCLGGFLLPWLKALGHIRKKFDFECPGVTSMSVDIHKYGFGPKGSSVVLYRNKQLRQYQFFTFTEWPGGIYCSPTAQGSRNGGLIASAWATLMFIGSNGYKQYADEIQKTFTALKEGISKNPYLKLLGDPEAACVSFTTDGSFDVYPIADAMAKRGWENLVRLQKPVGLMTQVGARRSFNVDDFLKCLNESVEEVLANPASGKEGLAPIYGMAANIPDRNLVGDILVGYMDALYKV